VGLSEQTHRRVKQGQTAPPKNTRTRRPQILETQQQAFAGTRSECCTLAHAPACRISVLPSQPVGLRAMLIDILTSRT
jgi:hypothetical protein